MSNTIDIDNMTKVHLSVTSHKLERAREPTHGEFGRQSVPIGIFFNIAYVEIQKEKL
jgi:hypothetical protein